MAEQQPDLMEQFITEAKRINPRMRAPMCHEDMCAAFDIKAAEIDLLRSQQEGQSGDERESFLRAMTVIGKREGWNFGDDQWDEAKGEWVDMYTNWMWWAWQAARLPTPPTGEKG
jgi:hypothetical protein